MLFVSYNKTHNFQPKGCSYRPCNWLKILGWGVWLQFVGHPLSQPYGPYRIGLFLCLPWRFAWEVEVVDFEQLGRMTWEAWDKVAVGRGGMAHSFVEDKHFVLGGSCGFEA